MPYLTQIHILELSAMCQTARVLVVFRDDKWSTPNEGDFVLTFSFVILFFLVPPQLICMFLLQ